MSNSINFRNLPPLDQSSRLPLYAQLANTLSTKIRKSQLKLAGQLLPSEMELAAHFSISRPTVRQAMEQLRAEGLIFRGRGKGTFVSPPRASRDLGQIAEFELMPPSRNIEFRLLQREHINASIEMRALFKMPSDAVIQRITRLRFIDDQIFAYEERFAPLEIASKISDASLENEAGVTFIRNLMHGDGGNVAFRFSAIPATQFLADMLQMKVSAPVLSSEHTYFSSDNSPILHGTIYFRGDRYDFGFRAPLRGTRSR